MWPPTPLPLLPAQLLWLNLATNGMQDVALAFEPEEGDLLDRKPRRPNEPIFDRVMLENCLVSGVLMAVLGFGAFRWMLHQGWSETSARNGLLLLMVMFENTLLGNARSETRPSLRLSPLRSPVLLVGAAAAFTLHASLMHLPIGKRLLGLEPISVGSWAGLISLALLMFSLVELHKARWRGRRGDYVRSRVNIPSSVSGTRSTTGTTRGGEFTGCPVPAREPISSTPNRNWGRLRISRHGSHDDNPLISGPRARPPRELHRGGRGERRIAWNLSTTQTSWSQRPSGCRRCSIWACRTLRSRG